MNRICIYTVLVGEEYDNLMQPVIVNDKYDYLCFVKKGQSKTNTIGIWQIEEVELDLNENVRISRFPKIMPHKTLLQNYEFSLYIDANILIKDKYIYDRIDELVALDEKIALLQHPFRDCVYQEAYVCIASLKGGWIDVIKQIMFLKKNNFPKHDGLYEANVIFRKHNDRHISNMDEIWWEVYMKYSKRDQLSLVYALKKTGIHVCFFLPQGMTTRNHPSFEKVSHISANNKHVSIFKKYIVKLIYGISKIILKE